MDLLRSGRGAPDAAEPLAVDRKHLHELLQITATRLRSGEVAPTLFAVVQLLGAECHRRILGEHRADQARSEN